MTIQFSGETPWDAIVNHNGLDIEEEVAFLTYLEREEIAVDTASLATLSEAYRLYAERQ